jgi:murein DD-endopeptidase MepM/ murein hydrolase activator NlpD
MPSTYRLDRQGGNMPNRDLRFGLGGALLGLALLVGCGTAGVGSRASGERACAWQVCMTVRSTLSARTFEVTNLEPVPATVVLSFRELQNLQADRPLPVRIVVPPETTLPLVRLLPIRRDRRVGAVPSISIDLGSSETDPDPDPDHLYAVPFGGTDAREIVQGFDGTDTHREGMRYALDFAMPEGTPVLAARAGTVLYVQDGFTEGGRDIELLERANIVVVAHSDGTMASYGHLAPGIPVRKGDTVAEGDLLGLSGVTGFTGQPHLHFHVGVRLLGDPGRTIRFRLRAPDTSPLPIEVGSLVEPARSER